MRIIENIITFPFILGEKTDNKFLKLMCFLLMILWFPVSFLFMCLDFLIIVILLPIDYMNGDL